MIKFIVLISIFITLFLFVVPARVNALGLNEVCKANGQNYGECTPPLKCVVQSKGQEGRVSWCQPASASSIMDVFETIELPPAIRNLGTGSAAISLVLSNIITLIFIAAGIVFLFMIVIGAFQFITSGGDKEAVGKARGRLTWAIVGITILALAFVIVQTVAEITGFGFLAGQPSPSPSPTNKLLGEHQTCRQLNGEPIRDSNGNILECAGVLTCKFTPPFDPQGGVGTWTCER